MKKGFLILSALVVASSAFAQTESMRMSLKLLNGQTVSYNVDDIDEITFKEEKYAVSVNTNNETDGRTYTTEEDGTTVVYWDTTAPEYAIRTVGFDGDGFMTGYDYVVSFSYWSENPVKTVEIRMVQNGGLLFPWQGNEPAYNELAHCVRTGSDSSAEGGEWKHLTFDVSRAWEKVGFNQSKNRLQDLCIQIVFDNNDPKVAQTFKVKDLQITPRVAQNLPEINLSYGTYGEGGDGSTMTEIENGYKFEFAADKNSHELYFVRPYVMPNCDYTLSFSYRVDYQMGAIWAHPLFPYVAFVGDLLLDDAPVVNEWKEVKVNLNDAFTAGHYWGVSREGAMLRMDFNPAIPGAPNTIEIKDIKLIPNP